MPLLLPGVTQGATAILISRNMHPLHDMSGCIAACARAQKVAVLYNDDMSVEHLIDVTT